MLTFDKEDLKAVENCIRAFNHCHFEKVKGEEVLILAQSIGLLAGIRKKIEAILAPSVEQPIARPAPKEKNESLRKRK